MASSNASSGGVGFLGLLTILFVGLKLTGHIDWTWFWVASPLWIGLLLTAAIALVGVALVLLSELIDWWNYRQ